MSKQYHVYIDEGGMFGNCKVLVTYYKQREPKNILESNIINYYFGKLSRRSLIHHLHMFQRLYPKCPIIFLKKSVITITQEEIRRAPGIG